MAKQRQVLDFCDCGKCYKVIRRLNADGNQYHIYHLYRDWDADGRPKDHKKLVVSYANMASCFAWFLQNNIGY